MVQEQYPQAREAFANAYALKPSEPEVLVDYAEAQMRAWPGTGFPPSAATLLEQALVAQPDHARGLFILGIYQANTGQPGKAVANWERLLPQLDAEPAAQLQAQINQARQARQFEIRQQPRLR